MKVVLILERCLFDPLVALRQNVIRVFLQSFIELANNFSLLKICLFGIVENLDTSRFVFGDFFELFDE